MDYEFAAATHVGRVRSNNEDAVAVNRTAKLALLADGMGGYNAGEVASEMAVGKVRAELARWLTQAGQHPLAAAVRQTIQQCLDHANRAILDAAHANPQYAGMGTTLVLAAFLGARLMLAHVGDSRCYRLRAGVLAQITRDHSWLQEQIDAGLLTRQQAANSSSRNLVTRALGVEEHMQADINEFEVQPGDLYLLCSDGLTEMVKDAQILALLEPPHSLQVKASGLIEAANAAGGRDNISVILAMAREPAPAQGPAATGAQA